MKNTAAIILAGGEGTRFNDGKPSKKPKVLYEVSGKPLISYSLKVLEGIGVEEVIIVVGYKGEEIRSALGNKYKYGIQKRPFGTGDATLSGLEKLSKESQNVMVLYGGDIYSEEILKSTLDTHQKENAKLTFVTVMIDNPTGFGRIVRNESGAVKSIVEEKVATKDQKKIKEINDGCYIFEREWLIKNINLLSASKIKEYFLTDLVEIAVNNKDKVSTFTLSDPKDWVGVDSFEDIEKAEKMFKGD